MMGSAKKDGSATYLPGGGLLKIRVCGDEHVRTPAENVSEDAFGSRELRNLVHAMTLTLRDAHGVGLAAPQVGESGRIIVVEDASPAAAGTPPELLELQQRYPVSLYSAVNPQLEVIDETTVEWFEACLSVPGYAAIVPRYQSVKLTAKTVDGAELVVEATGWHARILQHEVDHLDGVLIVDRMLSRSFVTREEYLRKLRGLSVNEVKSRLRV